MGILFAFSSAFCYALGTVLTKKGMSGRQTNAYFLTTFMNVVVIALALTVSILWTGFGRWNWVAVFFFVLSGALTTGLGRISLFASMSRLGPSRSAAIKNGAPIFTLLFALLILQERIDPLSWIGIFLMLIAIAIQGYFLFRQDGEEENRRSNRIGYLFAVISGLGFGIGQGVRQLGLDAWRDPILGAFLGVLTAFFIAIAIELAQGRLISTVKQSFAQASGWFYLSGTILGFGPIFFFLAIYFTQLSYVSMIMGAEPVFTTILSYFLLRGEGRIPLNVWLSVAFIVSGAVLIAFG